MATKRGHDQENEEGSNITSKRPRKETDKRSREQDKKQKIKLDDVNVKENDAEIITTNRFKIKRDREGTYKYIDTENKFCMAMEDLQKAIKEGKAIAVDCEGTEMSRFGSITMVNIAVRDLVYLIDVKVIGKIVFDRGLRSILEDDSVEKLMFDCREDADALFHLHNVKLNGVLDVQLMEVMKRGLDRGRLTKIRSLKHCMELYLYDDTLLKIKIQGRVNMSASNDLWERRPLAENMLEYASVDVLSLFQLYDILRVGIEHTRWRSTSARYCDNKRSRNRNYRDGNGYLPSGIL